MYGQFEVHVMLMQLTFERGGVFQILFLIYLRLELLRQIPASNEKNKMYFRKISQFLVFSLPTNFTN